MEKVKKVLFTATVSSHILQFHIPYLKYFKEKGYEVHVATNDAEEFPFCDVIHKISFNRSPIRIGNIKAIVELKKIIEKEKFDIIHTHTPMGSVVTRIAAKRARKKLGTRVIYTAHGFHFYKGAPMLNWIIYYPIEKILSYITDDLITINKEDYEIAKNKFKAKNTYYVPGVGIDSKKFAIELSTEEKNNVRKELGIEKNDYVLIYPAELSNRKRQIWLIDVLDKLLKENKNIHLLLPGNDSLNGKCQDLVSKLDLKKQIHILGYRDDIPQLIAISNIAISTSKQEGLPVNIMESMYYGLPIVVTDCRGNRDLVENQKNGYVVGLNDSNEFVNKILYFLHIDENQKEKIRDENKKMIEPYLLEDVLSKMKKIYEKNY